MKSCDVRTHLHWIHRLRLANYTQVVVLRALHFRLALLPHGSGEPLAMSMPGQGSDRGLAGPLVLRPVFPLAVSATVVGLGALPTFRHLVAALAALKAPEGLDPQGLGIARGFLSRAMFLDVGDVLGGPALAWRWWCGIGVAAREAVRSAGAALEFLHDWYWCDAGTGSSDQTRLT